MLSYSCNNTFVPVEGDVLYYWHIMCLNMVEVSTFSLAFAKYRVAVAH